MLAGLFGDDDENGEGSGAYAAGRKFVQAPPSARNSTQLAGLDNQGTVLRESSAVLGYPKSRAATHIACRTACHRRDHVLPELPAAGPVHEPRLS